MAAISVIELSFTMVFGLVGITVGGLVLCVLTHRRKPSASERLVVGLSVSEVCFNICYMGVLLCQKLLGIGNSRNQVHVMIFNSIDYFLFGFCLISSYLLIFGATISRYYAICRVHDFKKTFSKARVKRLVRISFLAGFIQACVNASFKWVPEMLQTLINIEFATALGLLLAVDAVAMLLVYAKVIKSFERLRKRLGISHRTEDNSARDQGRQAVTSGEKTVDLQKHSNQEGPAVPIVSESGHSCSRFPSAVDTRASADHTPGLRAAASSMAPPGIQLDTNIEQKKRLKREKLRTRYHYSREVSFSLLLISVIYIACVTPFTIVYLLHEMDVLNDSILDSIARLILQLKFVLNPIVYTRTSTFKNRSKRLWQNLRRSHGTPLPSTPSPMKLHGVTSLRQLFVSRASEL